MAPARNCSLLRPRSPLLPLHLRQGGGLPLRTGSIDSGIDHVDCRLCPAPLIASGLWLPRLFHPHPASSWGACWVRTLSCLKLPTRTAAPTDKPRLERCDPALGSLPVHVSLPTLRDPPSPASLAARSSSILALHRLLPGQKAGSPAGSFLPPTPSFKCPLPSAPCKSILGFPPPLRCSLPNDPWQFSAAPHFSPVSSVSCLAPTLSSGHSAGGGG